MKSLTMNVIPYANAHKNTNFNVANGNLKIGHQDRQVELNGRT